MTAAHTWEGAVQWLRGQPDKQDLVRFCFYDDPVEEAAARFHGTEEWAATRAILGPKLPGRVLDLGAGRGIAAYAFARDGCAVTALEPDPSPLVGRGAIEELCRRTGVGIETAAGFGEGLPFPDGTFDVVYGRAVLHHARDLPALLREVARVLRPGGLALFVREHVISRREDLPAFLHAHALHHLYGGENAYLLTEYRDAVRGAGLRLRAEWGPWDSPVNFWPASTAQVEELVRSRLTGRCGRAVGGLMTRLPLARRLAQRLLSRASREPGRHFAFLGERP